MEVDPFETFMRIVAIPQRRLALVGVVQMLHETAQPIVLWQLEKIPIKLTVVIPLPDLTEFATHEDQLLARMTVHPREEHPEVGEFLPFIARHFAQQRSLAMNDFVVAEDEHEMLAEGVHD